MSHKTIQELAKQSFILIDSGFVVNPDSVFSHFADMTPEEVVDWLVKDCTGYETLKDLNTALESGEQVDGATHNLSDFYHYINEHNQVMFYESDEGLTIGAFRKIKDKFEDSTFTYQLDRDAIALLAPRMDSEGRVVRLGDFIQYNYSDFGRVIWAEDGFYVYDDVTECIVHDLSFDSPITKIN